jgi:RNA polymerase sigma factor (sigma-70 family)
MRLAFGTGKGLSSVGAQLSTEKAPGASGRRSPLVKALDSPQTSEADLIAGLKAGDETAAHEFFDRYAARIRRFIASSLGAAIDDADDILQETFIALADALPFFRGDSSLFTFACAIAHRKVLSLIRTNARRARLMRAAPVTNDATPHDAGADPEFNRAVSELRPEYREVLILKYVEEIGVSEIARILRVSEHAVESRLARARKSLRKCLKEE